MSFTELKSGVGRAAFSLRALGDTHFLALASFSKLPAVLGLCPHLHLQSQFSLSLSVSLSLCLSLSFCFYNHISFCDSNLPISLL